MYKGQTLLAVIPARAGSKGLPNKNILECAGRPLIDWTIAAALKSKLIDQTIVSSDSRQILDVVAKYEGCFQLMRPSELATDEASMVDVLRHAWQSCLNSAQEHFDYIVLLQPTSPLRTSFHIDEAIKLYFERSLGETDTLASVYSADPKIGWLMREDDTCGYINFCFDVGLKNLQRQQLKPFYFPNGAIFILKGGTVHKGLYRPNTLPFIMSMSDSVDIDNIEDFKIAENLLLAK
jgi:CMP-N-acetylneuraminic acid synthetase